MTGVEIAWRTLNMERVEEPCILASWTMKRDFYRPYAGVRDIYADPVRTVVEAFAAAGAHLNPQFIMPSPTYEHLACGPERVVGAQITTSEKGPTPRTPQAKSPEDVRDAIEQMPAPEELEAEFDVETAAEAYAHPLLERRALSRDRTLFIGGYGIPGFMGGYGTWDMIQRYPEMFAAAVPICGGGDETAADRIKTPVWAFHGDKDGAVPVSRSRNMIAAIKAAGGQPKYTEYPGCGHNAWSRAFADPELLKWLFSHQRTGK